MLNISLNELILIPKSRGINDYKRMSENIEISERIFIAQEQKRPKKILMN